jgi:pimeloyl-ACP methyl ester carboxylesterase
VPDVGHLLRRRSLTHPLAILVLTIGVVTGCATAADEPASGIGPGAGGPAGDWQQCGDGVECTTLDVPADWADPEGARISLAVARRPATSGASRGVVLANPGGPGASGVDWLARTGDLAGIGADFDLVSWDPRGVGASTGLECGGVGGANGSEVHRLPTTGPQAEDTAEAVADFVAACAAGSPMLVDHLGTEQGVADMDAVRAAVGADEVDVVGFSYGTYLGLAYARAYPERVRTLVLDAVVNPADTLEGLLVAQAIAMEAALGEVLADDPGLWDRAAARTDPTTLAFAAIAASYDTTSLARLPDALSSAAAGDDTALVATADRYFGAASFPAYLGTLCADLERPTDAASQAAMADRLSAAAPRLGAAVAGEVAACAVWPVANGRRWIPETPPGVPVLLIAGTGDVATPPELARSVADELTGSVLVVREGGGHVSLGRSGCVANLVTRLLIDGTLPTDPTTCPR